MKTRYWLRRFGTAGLVTALLLSGTLPISAMAAEDDTDVIISQFMQMLNAVDTETKLELTFPVELSQEEESWAAQVQNLADELIDSVDSNLKEVFGETQYTAAEYFMPLMEYNNGTVMYWYSSEDSRLVAMQLQQGDSRYDWTVSLSQMPYEIVEADITDIPFELDYNMGDDEIRELLAGKAMCHEIVDRDGMMENSVYTVFLPEDETIEYVQIAAASLEHMSYLPPNYPDVELDIPKERKLWRVSYYLSDEAEPAQILEQMKAVWGKGISGQVDHGTGKKQQWSATVTTESVMDASVLKEALPEEAWKIKWNVYEEIRFDYGHETEPSCITYTGEAQNMIPIMLEALEK